MRFCIRKDFVHRKPVKGGENGTNVLPLFLTLSGVELLHFGLETRLSETKNITSYNSLSVMISTECKQTHRRSRCEGRITLFQMAQPSKIAEETRAWWITGCSSFLPHQVLRICLPAWLIWKMTTTVTPSYLLVCDAQQNADRSSLYIKLIKRLLLFLFERFSRSCCVYVCGACVLSWMCHRLLNAQRWICCSGVSVCLTCSTDNNPMHIISLLLFLSVRLCCPRLFVFALLHWLHSSWSKDGHRYSRMKGRMNEWESRAGRQSVRIGAGRDKWAVFADIKLSYWLIGGDEWKGCRSK